jgi:Flp pilus assembly protein TadD
VWRSSASLWSDTVRRAPARCEAHFNLAQAWLTESASASPDPGRLRAAEARCVWALRNKPGDARARVTLASLALAAGDPATAKALLFEGLKRDMNQAELWNALGFVYLAASEGEQGKAEASLRWAIELDGSLAAAHGNLGRALAVRGDWQGAVRCLEKAIEVGADRAAWRVALAEACLRLSAEEPALRGRALEHARQAARLEPGNPEVRRLLDRLEGPASPRR